MEKREISRDGTAESICSMMKYSQMPAVSIQHHSVNRRGTKGASVRHQSQGPRRPVPFGPRTVLGTGQRTINRIRQEPICAPVWP